MFKMTALSDLIENANLMHIFAVVSVAIAMAGIIQFASKGQGQTLTFISTAFAMTVNLFVLSFLAFAGWNSIIVQQYGSGDLFLSALVVFGVFMAFFLAHKSLAEPNFFHPIMFVIGGIVTFMMSGIFALILPLAGKISVWLQT